jgi:hypothetical protein
VLRRLVTTLVLTLVTSGSAVVLPAVDGAPAVAVTQQYSAPLSVAIGDLVGATEVRTGYSRTLFKHWTDADGDGCSTRNEVLISEADDPVTVGSGCSLTGGRWFSYYDGVSWTDPSDIDIDHMVPLAEAWDSGASGWSSAVREAFANDLDDYRSLVGVTDNVNQSKSDKDPADWLPAQQVCRYVREWVAVKHRWRLSVDGAERSALSSVASGCSDTTITVTLAR